MKCPCKECITLPACKNEDLLELVMKCSKVSEYLHVTKIRPEIVLSNGDKLKPKVFSNTRRTVHNFKLKRIKRFIPHSFTTN
jgi:hypothetical protein